MINGFDEMQKVGREGLTRSLESFGALTRGWQSIAGAAAALSKQSFEDGAAHVEKLFGVKSLDGALEAQAGFVKISYEKAVGGAARIGELYLDVVREAAKPFEDATPGK